MSFWCANRALMRFLLRNSKPLKEGVHNLEKGQLLRSVLFNNLQVEKSNAMTLLPLNKPDNTAWSTQDGGVVGCCMHQIFYHVSFGCYFSLVYGHVGCFGPSLNYSSTL